MTTPSIPGSIGAAHSYAEQACYQDEHIPIAENAFLAGTRWARDRLAAQEESILMTSREETISDRLSDAGYTEYAEDEDGGTTWVSAPLGEVLRIVSAAQEPTDGEVRALGRGLNEAGWTCHEGGDNPGFYDECEDCRRVCDDLARAALAAARAVLAENGGAR